MNTYKLSNIIKKENKNKNIRKISFSYKYLRSLFEQYECVEYLIKNYCCYGEDKCCWMDEERGWMAYGENYSVQQLNEQIFRSIKRTLNSINVYKRKIFIVETEEYIGVIIPLRDIFKDDVYLSFRKN